jgi:hypothetical protein
VQMLYLSNRCKRHVVYVPCSCIRRDCHCHVRLNTWVCPVGLRHSL